MAPKTKSPQQPPTAEPPRAVRAPAATCVRCGQAVQARYRPFCSQRCADIDLGQWISGTYRIPTQEEGEGADDAPGEGGSDGSGPA